MSYPDHRHDDYVREFKYRYHEPKLVEVQRPLRLSEPSYYQPAPMYGGPRPYGGGAGGGGLGYWRWRRERENRRFMWYVIIIVLLVASFLMLAALAMSQSAPVA